MNWYEEYLYRLRVLSNEALLQEVLFLAADNFDGQRRSQNERKYEAALVEFRGRLIACGYL